MTIRSDLIPYICGAVSPTASMIISESCGLVERISWGSSPSEVSPESDIKEVQALIRGLMVLSSNRKEEMDKLKSQWKAAGSLQKRFKDALEVYETTRLFAERVSATETKVFALGSPESNYAQRFFSQNSPMIQKNLAKTIKAVYPKVDAALARSFNFNNVWYKGTMTWVQGNIESLGMKPVKLERHHHFAPYYSSKNFPPRKEWEFTGGQFQILLNIEAITTIAASVGQGATSTTTKLKVAGGTLYYHHKHLMGFWGDTAHQWVGYKRYSR